jgi:iron complex outermembrane receptor protein
VSTQLNGGPFINFGSAPTDDFEAKEFTPKVGINWHPTDELLVYANYSKGFKSGGFNLPDPTPPAVDKVDSEKVDAIEVGIKASYSAVRISAAYFHYEAEGLQIQVTDATGGITSIRNAASSTTDGVEADVTWAVNRQFQLGGSIGYVDAKFDKFPDGQAFLPCPQFGAGQVDVSGTCTGPLGGLGLGTLVDDAQGNELPQAPKWTGNVRLDYTQPLSGSMGSLRVSVVDSYTSKFHWTTDNLFQESSKWLLNASIGWKSTDDRLGLSVYGTNLTDKDYNTQQAPFNGTGGWRVPGAPRQHGARISYDF